MPDASTLGMFSIAALALLVVPGPAVLYIVARSLDQGRAAGLVSVLGIHVGSLVHVVAAILGLSGLLARSALAFGLVKYVGAGYLIFLGLRRLVSREEGHPAAARQNGGLWRVFRQGVVVNTLNPKTTLFFLAFLPQFVDPDAGQAWLQLAVLGAVFIGLGLVSDTAYALLSAWSAGLVRASGTFTRVRRYVTGTVYVGLGLSAAFARRTAPG